MNREDLVPGGDLTRINTSLQTEIWLLDRRATKKTPVRAPPVWVYAGGMFTRQLHAVDAFMDAAPADAKSGWD